MSYIQGMSHIAFFLLLHLSPPKAFKLLANLIIGQKFLYKTFNFDKKYAKAAQNLSEVILQKYYPKVHSFFHKIGFCFGMNVWVENVYSLFLMNFSLDTCQRIWDALLTYGVAFIFRFFLALFDVLNDHLTSISHTRLSDDLRRFYFDHGNLILRRSYDTVKFEYEFYFIDRAIATDKLA